MLCFGAWCPSKSESAIKKTGENDWEMIGLKGKSNHNLIGAHSNPNRQTIAIFSLSNRIITMIGSEDWKI